MKKLLYAAPLLFSLKSYASTGGASDETLFIVTLVGLLVCIIALFELPRFVSKLKQRRLEKKRREFEKREAEQVNEENHYFVKV